MSDDKSPGTRVGEALDRAGDKFSDATEAVKERVSSAADQGRAAVHDARVQTADNPVDRLVKQGKGAVDRVTADLHDANTDIHSEAAKGRSTVKLRVGSVRPHPQPLAG